MTFASATQCPSFMTFASATQFHVYLPWGQCLFSIMSFNQGVLLDDCEIIRITFVSSSTVLSACWKTRVNTSAAALEPGPGTELDTTMNGLGR